MEIKKRFRKNQPVIIPEGYYPYYIQYNKHKGCSSGSPYNNDAIIAFNNSEAKTAVVYFKNTVEEKKLDAEVLKAEVLKNKELAIIAKEQKRLKTLFVKPLKRKIKKVYSGLFYNKYITEIGFNDIKRQITDDDYSKWYYYI